MRMIENVVYKLTHLLFITALTSFSNAHFYKINVHKHNHADVVQKVTFQIDAQLQTISIQQRNTDISTEWIVDDKRGLQIYKATILGEQDRFEPIAYTICMVLSLKEKDVVPMFVVMQHLYQIDPTVKHFSTNQLNDTLAIMDLELNADGLKENDFDSIPACKGAHSVYSSQRDVRFVSKGNESVEMKYMNLSTSLPTSDASTYPSCKNASPFWNLGCFCEVRLCMDWFPCKFKYCHETDDLGSDVSYICGLDTCSRCQTFIFFVERKQTCFWNIHSDS